jgi:hypothetical protein
LKRLPPLLALIAVVLAGCSIGQPKDASDVTAVTATLNADISSNQGGEVKYWFRYGTTTDYGTETPDRTLQFPEGHTAEDDPIAASEPISGLEPDTTYHYQVCTSPGIEPGSRGCTPLDHTFTTASLSDRADGSGTLEWEHAPPGSITEFDFDASSGANGEDAAGTFSFSYSFGGEPVNGFSGTVSCLAVAGDEATLGGVITASTYSVIFQPGERLRFTVRDAEQGAGSDEVSSLHVQSGPDHCEAVPDSVYHPLLSGDIVVQDEEPTPP